METKNKGGSRQVDQLDLDGVWVKTWNSTTEAARSFGAKCGTNIIYACQQKAKTAYGFKWMYAPQPDLPQEIWKQSAFPNYMVSSKGRVLNVTHGRKTFGGKNPSGYMNFHIGKGKLWKTVYVHRLIAMAFLPPPDSPDKCFVDHKNGIKHDNRVENLSWVTCEENNRRYMELRYKRGLRETKYFGKMDLLD